jgi:adenylate kinase family enzyme
MQLPNMVGFAGPQGSGKDTCGEILAQSYNYIQMAFANPVRAGLYALNPLIELDNGIVARLQTVVDQIGWDSAKRNSKDLRGLMQRFGTEAGRDLHGYNCWVAIAERLAKVNRNYTFTDVRFPNEADWIRSCGGIIVYVDRDDVPAQAANHKSEECNVKEDADFIIFNNGTKTELGTQLTQIIKAWNLA